MTSIHLDFVIDWEKSLGSGCNGHVRLCTEKSTGKEFALKILIDNQHSRREAYIHQQLSGHPHIVHLHSVYCNIAKLTESATPRPLLFLVIEMMNGGNLKQCIARGINNEDAVAKYMTQIVDALKFVHGLGLAHRDIKLENILISDDTEDGVVKLGDFGFAEFNDYLNSTSCTPSYVAPEVLQLRNALENSKHDGANRLPKYDQRCDLWSLGVTMYCLLSKRHPFQIKNEDRCAMNMRILGGNYQFRSKIWKTISQEAKDIVQRLLQVDPSKRISAEELADHPWLRKTYSVPNRSNFPSSPIFETIEEKIEVPRQGMTVKNDIPTVKDSDDESAVKFPRQGMTVKNNVPAIVTQCCNRGYADHVDVAVHSTYQKTMMEMVQLYSMMDCDKATSSKFTDIADNSFLRRQKRRHCVSNENSEPPRKNTRISEDPFGL